jgi:hypothetical protein
LPEVYTARGRKVDTYFRNCDLAHDGSPTTRGLHSFTSQLKLSRFGQTSPCPPV